MTCTIYILTPIVIPEKIDGYTVKYVGSLRSSFANDYVDMIRMGKYNESYYVMGKNRLSTQSLVIPETVEYIGSGAFANCNNLQRITFPRNSKVEVSYGAFSQCKNLKDISLYSVNIKADAFSTGSPIERLEFNNTCFIEDTRGDEINMDFFSRINKLVLNGHSVCNIYELGAINEIYVNDEAKLTSEEFGGSVKKLYLNGKNATYKGIPKSARSVLYTIPCHKKAIKIYKEQWLTYHIKSTGSMKKVTRKKSGKKYRYTWKKVKTTIKTHKYNWDKGKWKKTKKNIATQYQIYGKAKKSDTYQLLKTTKKRKCQPFLKMSQKIKFICPGLPGHLFC